MDCSEFNRLLDGYIDGELDEAQRAMLENHAAQCVKCKENLAAAEQLRDILSHLNDDISVPLPAQAAWRKAVKEEARRKRMKRIYSVCGAVAAAFVLMLGVTAMLKSDNASSLMPDVSRVETDGVAVVAAEKEADAEPMVMRVRSVEYIDRTIAVEDTAQAYEYLCDIITEYGGTIERETDGDERRVFVQISGENAAEFLSAVDSIGEISDNAIVAVDEAAHEIGICVIIAGV